MKTIRIGAGILEPDSLHACVEALQRGEIICYPTETYYALGIDFKNQIAISSLYALKQRIAEKELPLIAFDIAMVSSICNTNDPRFGVLVRKFWPGPLTLVLPSLDHAKSFAIRVSPHPVARQLTEAFGTPIVSTSANRTGEPAISDPSELPESILNHVAYLVDAGESVGGAPSTIVSLLQSPGKILREGAIPAEQIVSLL